MKDEFILHTNKGMSCLYKQFDEVANVIQDKEIIGIINLANKHYMELMKIHVSMNDFIKRIKSLPQKKKRVKYSSLINYYIDYCSKKMEKIYNMLNDYPKKEMKKFELIHNNLSTIIKTKTKDIVNKKDKLKKLIKINEEIDGFYIELMKIPTNKQVTKKRLYGE